MQRASKLRSAGLAFFALFFLVLQPVCAAYERHLGTPQVDSAASAHDVAHPDDASHALHDSTPCCSEMQADAIAPGTSAVAAERTFPREMSVPLRLALPAPPGLTIRSHSAWNAPPPLPLPYHARSARILR